MLTHPIIRPLVCPLASPLSGIGVAPPAPIPVRVRGKCGQSNQIARSDIADPVYPAPDASAVGLVYLPGDDSLVVLDAAAELAIGATTGSCRPSEAVQHFADTGEMLVFAVHAVSGTLQTPDTAGGNWSASGTLTDEFIAVVNAAVAKIEADPRYELVAIDVVDYQGEADALAFASVADFAAAKSALVDRLMAGIPGCEKVYLTPISGHATAGGLVKQADTTTRSFQKIRKAVFDVAETNPDAAIFYPGMYAAVSDGGLQDAVHANQKYQNKNGTAGARQAAIPAAREAVSAILGVEVFADATTTGKSSRTLGLAIPANCKSIIFCNGSARLLNAGSFTNSGTLAKGAGTVTTRKCAYSQATSSSPATRCNAGIQVLNESDYGASFAAQALNYVAAATSAQNTFHVAAIYLAEEMVPDEEPTDVVEINGGSSAVVSATISTSGPAIIVTVGSATAATASPPTCTITGATEIMDAGIASATPRAGLCAIGYSIEAARVTDKLIEFTWASVCDHGAATSVAFRRKVYGE